MKRKTFSVFLAIVGAVLIYRGIVGSSSTINSYSFDQIPESAETFQQEVDEKQDVVFGEPTRIIIENLEIDLNIESSSIVDGAWQVSDDGVSFLDRSAMPSQGGNIVLYGHNKKHILGNIYDIRVGDVINIYDDEGFVLKYEVEQTFTVTPDEVSVVQPTDHEVLTLYTCIGPFDSKRFIIKAKPVLDS